MSLRRSLSWWRSSGGAGAQVHGVAHGGGGAAVAGDGLDDHGGAQVALTAAAELLRDGQAHQAHGGQGFEVLARVDVLLVALDGVGAQGGFAQGDQVGLQGLLLGAEQPLGAPFGTDTDGGHLGDGVHGGFLCWGV
jgi:hypothetical protein